jgi:AcrR family transcriptional regulator
MNGVHNSGKVGQQMFSENPPKRDKKQEMRSKLISVARDEIREYGLLNLSARSVAEAAGVALGSLYTVFADLDALVFVVNLESFQSLDDVMAQASAGATLPQEKLSALVWAYLAFARDEPHLWRCLFDHLVPDDKSVPAENMQALGKLMLHIEEPLRHLNPELDHDARLIRARTLFSAFHGVISMSLDRRMLGLADEQLEAELQFLLDRLFTASQIRK